MVRGIQKEPSVRNNATETRAVMQASTATAAERRASEARTWTAIGWVGVGVGAVMSAVGAGWLFAPDDSNRSSGVVEVVPVREGLVVGTRAGF